MAGEGDEEMAIGGVTVGNGTVVVYWENYDFSRVSVREQALYANVYTVTYTHTL